MRKIFFTLLSLYTIGIIVAFITLMTRHRQHEEVIEKKENMEAQCDSAVVNAVRSHSVLYTAEARSSKTMTYSQNSKISFNFLGIDKDVNVPFSKTEATIPVTVTYKAGINLSQVSAANIQITKYPAADAVPGQGSGGSVIITLPDPVLVETAVSVDHENEILKKEFLGKGLKYEQYQQLVRQAKQEAWGDLSEDDIRAIIETAKVSATDILLPQLRSLGFTDIQITFRQDLDYTQIERRSK